MYVIGVWQQVTLVTVWKSKASFIMARKQHSCVAAHHDDSKDSQHQNGDSAAEVILILDNNPKPYFLTCINTEIIPFQLSEMSQGKPTCRSVCLFACFEVTTLVITRSLSLMLHLKPVTPSVMTSLVVNPYPF